MPTKSECSVLSNWNLPFKANLFSLEQKRQKRCHLLVVLWYFFRIKILKLNLYSFGGTWEQLEGIHFQIFNIHMYSFLKLPRKTPVFSWFSLSLSPFTITLLIQSYWMFIALRDKNAVCQTQDYVNIGICEATFHQGAKSIPFLPIHLIKIHGSNTFLFF